MGTTNAAARTPRAVMVGLLLLGCSADDAETDTMLRRAQLGAAHDPNAAPGDEDLALQISPQEGKADLLARFRASPVDAEAGILSYAWDFGDGTTSTEAEPEHTFRDPGRYDVTLTAELDLNHVAIGMTEIVDATQPVYATATEWVVAELDLDLGDGWGLGSSALGCDAAIDCGPLKMRLPGAPDGVYDLTVRLDYRAEDGPAPAPRFMLDGELYDLVPDAGGETGLVFTELKTVVVSNHELELEWDYIEGSGVLFTHVVLNPADGYENAEVEITPSVDLGELPLRVDFAVDSNVEIAAYRWVFGDGKESNGASPSHKYKKMGRMEVALHFEDSEGVAGLATTVVTVKPSKVRLPGLDHLDQLGIWSAGFRNDADAFNERRREELETLNIGFVGPAGVSGSKYGTSEGAAASIHADLDAHAAHGIVTGTEVVQKHDWYTNDDNGQPPSEWVFDTTAAQALFGATDYDGDGISDLEGSVSWVYLGHEMGEYASRAERSQMVEVTREWFPNTQIYPYYGGIKKSFEQADTMHSAGGLQEEYQVGPGDSDIIGVTVSGPFAKLGSGETVFDPRWTLEQLRRDAGYANFHFDEPRLWVNVNLPGESPESTAESMWSAEQILDYARTLLSEEASGFLAQGFIESLSFRAYDRFEFDLAYGINTEDPTQEEEGFIEQREAVKWVGSWIEQTKAGLPILIIRQPEMQQTRKGPTIDVEYGIIGEQTELVADVVLQLDDREPVHDPDLDGVAPLEDVEVGTHTLYAHIADADGNVIPGGDLRVLSVHVEEGDAPTTDDGGSESGSSDGAGAGEDDDTAGSGAPNDTEDPTAPGASGPGAAGGCGCSAQGLTTPGPWALLLGVALAFVRRRR